MNNSSLLFFARHLTSPLRLVALFALSTPALAFQPLVSDDTGTQGAGGNQLEFAYSQERTRIDGHTGRHTSLPAVYTHGLTETLDVFAGSHYDRLHPAGGESSSGFGNASLGMKWRWYENKDSKTSLAVKPELLFPVSSRREAAGQGSGKLSGNLTLILSQEVPFGAVHINAGLGRERFRDPAQNPDTTYRRASIAPVWDVNERWKLALDLGLESARSNGNSTLSKFIGAGIVYSPTKQIDLALGVFRSTDNAPPAQSATR